MPVHDEAADGRLLICGGHLGIRELTKLPATVAHHQRAHVDRRSRLSLDLQRAVEHKGVDRDTGTTHHERRPPRDTYRRRGWQATGQDGDARRERRLQHNRRARFHGDAPELPGDGRLHRGAQTAQCRRVHAVDCELCRRRRVRRHALRRQPGGGDNVVLAREVAKVERVLCEADAVVRQHCLCKVLHHALKPRGRLERGARLVGEFWVDELVDVACRQREHLQVRVHVQHELVDVARELGEARVRLVDVALAAAGR
mmetsp:Transcript_26082/g.84214  ORF Transcript_26082/g.84214 Transcript_26082/m.84214 type:complete len:257 (+) Transcript_26082:394-1164(+)|eukprot:scaffold6196_cov113-Isochrysis_galbana.AAC.7